MALQHAAHSVGRARAPPYVRARRLRVVGASCCTVPWRQSKRMGDMGPLMIAGLSMLLEPLHRAFGRARGIQRSWARPSSSSDDRPR